MNLPKSFVLLLRIPVPPMLEDVLFCDGSDTYLDSLGRHVGFWWEPRDEELVVNTGEQETCGTCSFEAWKGFSLHERVRPHLAPYRLDDPAAPATYALVLDRYDRRFYVTPILEARKFLHEMAISEERLPPEAILPAIGARAGAPAIEPITAREWLEQSASQEWDLKAMEAQLESALHQQVEHVERLQQFLGRQR